VNAEVQRPFIATSSGVIEREPTRPRLDTRAGFASARSATLHPKLEALTVNRDLDRRTFLRRSGLTAAGLPLVSLTGLLAACSGDDSSTSSAGGTVSADGVLTLRMPFLLDMQVPDPDIMYEGEGLQVMLSCYEGLIDYKQGSSEFEPQLAESWEVSADLLTYTFKLRPGVLFHDGTPADAESWIKSFERRRDIAQGAAYMVADVATTAAPDATTFVVTLKQPNDAFLDYLACPWKPYAVSPTAVAANAVGDDLAQEWLSTHDAGTGPYIMKEFVPSSHYTIEAFPDYWGTKPTFTQAIMEIVPDVTTQRLKLESGEFDLVTKGFSIEDVKAFEKNDKFQVIPLQETSIIALMLNATSGMFTDKALRQALVKSIDREAVIDPTYQGLTTVIDDYFAPAMFPTGLAPFDQGYDPSVLEGLVKDLDSKKVDLAYSESGGAPYRRMAELVQTQLAAVGLDVTVRGMPSSQVFALATGPADQRPDILLWVHGGDALHVDTVLRIFFRTGAAPLNWAQYTLPELDEEMDVALTEPTEDEVNAHYVDMAEIMMDEAWVLPLALRPAVIIARKGISNFDSDSYLPSIITFNLLENE
jgi:peptide/nickel transport system substrate-binding protein